MTIRASISGVPMGSETSSKAYIIPTSPETTNQPVRMAANTTKPNVNGGKAKTTNQFSWNRSNQNNELKSLKWGFLSPKYTSVLMLTLSACVQPNTQVLISTGICSCRVQWFVILVQSLPFFSQCEVVQLISAIEVKHTVYAWLEESVFVCTVCTYYTHNEIHSMHA